jgi:Protein of unknown function (DUF2442)
MIIGGPGRQWNSSFARRSTSRGGFAEGPEISTEPPRSIELVEELVHITAVEVIGVYRLRLRFEDGTVGDVDFTGRDWRGVFEPLRDPSYFARVAVDPEWGTIAWPNGLDIAPEPLYAEARRHLVQAAEPTR